MYGFFAGPYVSSWAGIIKHVTHDNMTHEGRAERVSQARRVFDPAMIIGLPNAERGIGNLVSGPLSEGLIKGLPWKGLVFGGYGSGYGPLIAFTGVTAIFGGATFLWKRVGWM